MSGRRPAHAGGRRLELHAHTRYSDGTLSPAELVELARSRKLSALAITDHDTVDGVAEARLAAGDTIEIVPGIEISSARDGWDLHVLGYFVDAESVALRTRLEQFRDERRGRARAILERLESLGVSVDEREVFESAGPGVVGRPHVAGALLRAGHVTSMDDAFRRYLGPRGTAFVPRPAFRPEDAIELIRAAGGVAVLAHPGSKLPVLVVESLASAGLGGIEVWHPVHGKAAMDRWRRVAKRLHLVESGGSDFHGPARGAGLGEMSVPGDTLERLREAAGAARRGRPPAR